MELVRRFESKHWGWWYLAIGVGYVLLAVVNLLQGAGLGAFALRMGVAAGFTFLGWMQFRYGR